MALEEESPPADLVGETGICKFQPCSNCCGCWGMGGVGHGRSGGPARRGCLHAGSWQSAGSSWVQPAPASHS